MAEDRKGLKIKEDGLGEVQIAEEVITIIAGLAATEVEGVCSMGGNITKELVSRLGTVSYTHLDVYKRQVMSI